MQDELNAIIARLGLTLGAFNGQVAVITGAGSGIGRALSRLLARAGAQVIIAELSESGQEAAAEICQEGGQAEFVRTDVASTESVAALAARVTQTYGPPDLLVNNAIVHPVGSVVEMSVETWDRAMAVNLRGGFLTCHHFLPGMLARGRGVIVNMISADAVPFMSAYIASKQGLAAFSQSLAAEVGEGGVKVIALAPGFVDTPGLRASAADLAPRMGLTPGEFLEMPFHPVTSAVETYGGAMPALHAGAAVLPLLSGLASDYHGKIITGYEILERVGFLKPADAGTSTAANTTQSAPPPAASTPSAGELAAQLAEMIAQTEAEFGRLPVFARPLAKGGFKSKAGGSLEEWKTLAARWQSTLSRPGEAFDVSAVCARLEALAGYYRGVPAQSARFSKDSAFLDEVNRITRERLAVIDALKEAVKRGG